MLEAYLPLDESRWPVLIGNCVSETHFQNFSKTHPTIVRGNPEAGRYGLASAPVVQKM